MSGSIRPEHAAPDPESSPDIELARHGDRAAFERLYRRTVARTHTLARRLLGAAQADDATQEIYLRAWTKLRTFRGESRFATWLHRLAVHALLNERELARRREGRTAELDLASVPAKPEAATGASSDLERALDHLPQAARAVFVLHDIEGMSHEDAARVLGVSTGTTKSQLHRARMLLREHLSGGRGG